MKIKKDYLNDTATKYACLMLLTKQRNILFHFSFLATKTNVDYQVVGSFAVQDETTDAISEAISILKSWNSKT